MEAFFNGEGGSISHSQVKCSMYEVMVDIHDSSLSLTSSFIEAIKRIDLATTEGEKDNAMKDLISNFGTHYAKKTLMGIGVYFETRYNEEEKITHDSQTRNECSSRSGGFSIFGIGLGSDSSKCSGSLEDTTAGADTAAKRFTFTTYGTMVYGTSLSDWGEKTTKMWALHYPSAKSSKSS